LRCFWRRYTDKELFFSASPFETVVPRWARFRREDSVYDLEPPRHGEGRPREEIFMKSATPPASRRKLLAATAAFAGGLALRGTAARGQFLDIPPWTKEQGTPVAGNPYGVPSPFESKVVRRARTTPTFPTAASSGTPLQDLHGIITPNGLHFERHHAGIPAIDPGRHRLLIHGLVERPLVLTVDDIVRFPSVSRLHFLECSGNTPEWRDAKAGWTPQETHGLLSCCEWTGVLLSTLLAEVGIGSEAR